MCVETFFLSKDDLPPGSEVPGERVRGGVRHLRRVHPGHAGGLWPAAAGGHFYDLLDLGNPFLPTVPTFAVRETGWRLSA